MSSTVNAVGNISAAGKNWAMPHLIPSNTARPAKKKSTGKQKAAYRKRCKQVEQLNTLRQEQAEASALYEELHERRVYKGLQSKETRLLRERILQLEQCNRNLLRYIQTLEE